MGELSGVDVEEVSLASFVSLVYWLLPIRACTQDHRFICLDTGKGTVSKGVCSVLFLCKPKLRLVSLASFLSLDHRGKCLDTGALRR